MKLRDRILKLLEVSNKPLTGYEIQSITNGWTGSVYLKLYKLRDERLIIDSKIDGRWVYQLRLNK